MTPQPPVTPPTKAELREQLSHVEYQLALINAQDRDEDKMLQARRAKIKALEQEIADIQERSLTAPDRRAKLLNSRQSVLQQLSQLELSSAKAPSLSKQVNALFDKVLARVLTTGQPSPKELSFLQSCRSTTKWAELWEEYKELDHE